MSHESFTPEFLRPQITYKSVGDKISRSIFEEICFSKAVSDNSPEREEQYRKAGVENIKQLSMVSLSEEHSSKRRKMKLESSNDEKNLKENEVFFYLISGERIILPCAKNAENNFLNCFHCGDLK